MSDRPKITALLSLSIQHHICPNNDPRVYWAREVTFDYTTADAKRIDFMKFKPVNNTVSGIAYDRAIKIVKRGEKKKC